MVRKEAFISQATSVRKEHGVTGTHHHRHLQHKQVAAAATLQSKHDATRKAVETKDSVDGVRSLASEVETARRQLAAAAVGISAAARKGGHLLAHQQQAEDEQLEDQVLEISLRA